MVRRLAVLALCMLHASTAAAADDKDGAHGRVDGDMSAEIGVGGAIGPRAPRALADLRLRYLWTAGLFVTYEDAPLVGSGSEPRRVIATGLELRPLFIGRWLKNMESGNAYADLTLDSIALELGAAFQQPVGASFGSRPALQAGLGLELPVFPRASGPVIGVHGGCRWSDTALGGGSIAGPVDRALYLGISVGWAQVFGAHVVDAGDRAP